MVRKKEHKEERFYCEFPGCNSWYHSEERAQECQNKGLIGPKIKPGLVLGSPGLKSTYIKDEQDKHIQGLSELDIYLLTSEAQPQGHERVYEFHRMHFYAPRGVFISKEEKSKYEYGKKHKWEFIQKEITISDLEKDLDPSWVEDPRHFRELSQKDFTPIMNFLNTDKNAQEARKFLKGQKLEGKLRNKSAFVKKIIDKQWDDYYNS